MAALVITALSSQSALPSLGQSLPSPCGMILSITLDGNKRNLLCNDNGREDTVYTFCTYICISILDISVCAVNSSKIQREIFSGFVALVLLPLSDLHYHQSSVLMANGQ